MEMREILHLPLEAPIGMPQVDLWTTPTFPILPSLYEAWRSLKRQEIKMLNARIGKMDAMIEMAETMLLPALDMGLSRSTRTTPSIEVGTQAGQATFSHPNSRCLTARWLPCPKGPGSAFADAYLREMRQKRLAHAAKS